MISDCYIRHPYMFATTEGKYYVGWWAGKEFESKVFAPSKKKEAIELLKELKKADVGD